MHCHSHPINRTTCYKELWKWNRWMVTFEQITPLFLCHFLSTTFIFFVCSFVFHFLSLSPPPISTCTYLTFISPFSVSRICIAISFTLSSVLSFGGKVIWCPHVKQIWAESSSKNEGNEDKTPAWVTVLQSKTTYMHVFDSDRIGSCFGTAFEDKPTEWEEHFVNRFCTITAINGRTGLVTRIPFGMGYIFRNRSLQFRT